MAETITVLGKQYPKSWLYVFGALGVGIVGYAWFTKSTTDDEFVEEDLLLDSYGDERIPPTTIDSSQVQVDTRAGFKTDQEWFNAALEKLIYEYGNVDVPMASDTLTKYLNKEELTAEQIRMVNFVINSLGPPPVAGRLPLRQKPPSTTPPGPTPSTQRPKPPTNVKVSYPGRGPNITITWTASSGATRYFIQRDGGPEGRQPKVNIGNTTVHKTVARVKPPGHYYGWHIWAGNAVGESTPVPTGVVLVKP